ncbi:hypothetical protein [Deinococcus cellulosilyticus]|uniref:Uncharacterized protein n=1 Tax=Deinococcus cellulosilyticus (strain DSM 18568 / NBRC 106333 / KACC 11606 / 5516J-15) TaxID=1223518 RepID=A0A511N6Q5_DEIC1|nr:hypothetical protein [Deinococcus cellulosilyticus]GEM48525.1 hypothetical protein DC3_41600 [Deinococcus cellulosilyticus NBRC 106333 = KACC 11606]
MGKLTLVVALLLGTVAQAAGVTNASILKELEKTGKFKAQKNPFCQALAKENSEKITSYVSSLGSRDLQKALIKFSMDRADASAGGKSKKNPLLKRHNDWVDEGDGSFSQMFSAYGTKTFDPSLVVYIKAAGKTTHVCTLIR